MKNIVIENLRKEEDLKTLAKEYANYFQNSVLDEAWTTETASAMFKYFYNHASDLFLVAYDNEKPVGCIMTCLKPWWDGLHLEDGELFVIPEYRKNGIAKNLLKTLFDFAIEKYNAVTLEAHTYEDENGFPYCWYKKLGFDTIDDWKIITGDIKEIVKKL